MSGQDELLERNRLNKENAERGMVLAIFASMINTSHIVDKFSMWLFAGTGVTGALLITQINSILLSMPIVGFKYCIFMLIGSSTCAFIAKYFSLYCQIHNEMTAIFTEKAKVISAKHEENEERIEEIAKGQGLKLETGIDINNVFKEYVRPFPKSAQRKFNHYIKRIEDDPQALYHIIVQAYFKQTGYTILQALFFIGFMCVGGWYAGDL